MVVRIQPLPPLAPSLRFGIKIDCAGQVDYNVPEKNGRQVLSHWDKRYLAEVAGPDSGGGASWLLFGPSWHVPSDLEGACPELTDEKWMEIRHEIKRIREMAQARRAQLWNIAIRNPYMGLRDQVNCSVLFCSALIIFVLLALRCSASRSSTLL